VFRYNKPKSRSFQRQIWRYDLADYDRMRLMLSSEDWSSLKHANLDTSVDNVTSTIIKPAKHCIPTKLVNMSHNNMQPICSPVHFIMVHDWCKLVGCLGCLARDSSHIKTSLDRLKQNGRTSQEGKRASRRRYQLRLRLKIWR